MGELRKVQRNLEQVKTLKKLLKKNYIKNINNFNKNIPIFDNNVKINITKIEGATFEMNFNNIINCKNMYLMFIKDDALIKIPDKSVYRYSTKD